MVAVIAIMFFVIYLDFFFSFETKPKKTAQNSAKYSAQMKKLWQIAQTAMKERKPFRAEKALLTILKFDEKNAAAYNRLGILYAKGQKYDEAVECFEIAQSLDSNPASIHNAGLIYLEIGAYEKAGIAFRQAIALEGDVPARYIALAKAEEKMGRPKKAVEALESAFELDPKVSTLRQILAIYEKGGDTEAATATSARIEEQIARETEAKLKRSASIRAASNSRGRLLRTRTNARRAPAANVAGSDVALGTNAASSNTASAAKPTLKPRRRIGTRTPNRIIKPHVGRKRV